MVRCGHTILLLFYPISRACASCGAGLPRQYFAGMHPPTVLPIFPRMRLMWCGPSSTVLCGHASVLPLFPRMHPMWRRRSLLVRCGHTILLLFYPFSHACASCGAGLPRQYFAGTHPPSVLPLFPCMHLMWCGPSSKVLCRRASSFCSTHFPVHAPHVVRAFLDSTLRACILLLF